jgi:hypothetical protein
MTLHLLLLVTAFILFVLAAVGAPLGRINLVAAGLALWVLSAILPPGL